jgi:exopolysaccharide biosynthesis polyprenyl glycosylphosphotransferase
MIVSRTSKLPRKKLLLAMGDGLCTLAAILAAIVLRLGWPEAFEYIQTHGVAIGTSWALFILAYYIGGLYENNRLQHVGRMLAAAIISVSIGTVLITSVFYATLSDQKIGRGIFVGFAAFVFLAVVLLRLLYIIASRRGFMSQRSLIIGTNGEARKVIDLVEQHAHAGLRVLGLIHCGTDKSCVGKFVGDFPILGTLETLERFVELYEIERLILAATAETEPEMLRRLRSFRYRGLALVDFVSLHEELALEIPLDHIDDEWLFMASMDNSRIHIRRLKRLCDIVTSLLGLAVGALPMLVTALLVRVSSRGPILFRQERLGRDSVPFTLLKFRTMRDDAESDTGPVWATDDDPRVTPIGRWLRKFRLDELPQLINVLRGEMSLVGPRPEREVFIRQLSEKIPFYAERLLVPPGITGWAQVKAPYAASVEDSRRKLQFDIYYIKHMSFFLDMYIFLKTLKTILFGRERTKATPPKTASRPPRPAIKTDTLFFGAERGGAASQAPSETDAPRHTQRLA